MKIERVLQEGGVHQNLLVLHLPMHATGEGSGCRQCVSAVSSEGCHPNVLCTRHLPKSNHVLSRRKVMMVKPQDYHREICQWKVSTYLMCWHKHPRSRLGGLKNHDGNVEGPYCEFTDRNGK
eukprot:4515963-Amphidinium_carterae.1